MTSKEIRAKVKTTCPLIHAITNPISINECANTILAVGARPIMAEHPKEVCEITASADALVLNTGNITDVRMKSMKIAIAKANEINIPVVLDAVGVSCSLLRKKYVQKLLKRFSVTVIKGNYSEIYALAKCGYSSPGVDAQKTLNKEDVQKAAVALAKRHKAIILASGSEDIVTDGDRIFIIKNGNLMLRCVTGTGCMLGMLCGCFLVAEVSLRAVCTAALVLGICGEIADSQKGQGSYLKELMDNLSLLSDLTFDKHLKLEELKIENI